MKRKLLLSTIILTFLMSSTSVCAQALCEEEFRVDDTSIALLQENPELVYTRYSNVIDIQEVSLDDYAVAENVMAYEYAEDGTVLQELDTEVTLNKVICENVSSGLRSSDGDVVTYYVMSARASKTSDDSLTKDGITVSGTIYWEDNLGPVNQFLSCSGSRSGSYSGEGYYQVLRGTSTLCHGNFSGSNFASAADSGKDTTGLEFQLIVRSNGVQVLVKTSIFD